MNTAQNQSNNANLPLFLRFSDAGTFPNGKRILHGFPPQTLLYDPTQPLSCVHCLKGVASNLPASLCRSLRENSSQTGDSAQAT